MFGLMRPVRKCSGDAKYKGKARMHYCGTCKTIGQEYGQSSRMLLNYDAVFLAELLTLLSNADTNDWNAALKATNICFTMPKKNEESPVPLRYAAATNVFLAALKTDDNIRDKAAKRYKLLRWFLSDSFKKSAAELESFGLDISFFWQQVELQQRLESESRANFDNLSNLFSYYASPTVAMTAALFERAAFAIQRPDYAVDLAEIGAQLGLIVYALDAFEDLQRDIYSGEFNPLVIFLGLAKDLPANEADLDKVRAQILAFQSDLEAMFEKLALNSAYQADFVARLTSNLAIRLYKEQPPVMSVGARLRLRWQNAKERAYNIICQPDSWHKKLQFQALSVLFFALPMLSVESSGADKANLWSSVAILTALLAAVGLVAPITPIKEKKSRWQRFKNRLFFWRKERAKMCDTDYCEDCCDDCESCLIILGISILVIIGLSLLVAVLIIIGRAYGWTSIIIAFGALTAGFLLFLLIKMIINTPKRRARKAAERAVDKEVNEREAILKEFFKTNAARSGVKILENGVQYEVLSEGNASKPIKWNSQITYVRDKGENMPVETMYVDFKGFNSKNFRELYNYLPQNTIESLFKFEDTEIKFYVPRYENPIYSSTPFDKKLHSCETFVIKAQKNPDLFRTASGLEYKIIAKGDAAISADAAAQLIVYRQSCSERKNYDNSLNCSRITVAPYRFKAGSFEAEAYALMPKNAGVIYDFYLPNKTSEKIDFRIEITDKQEYSTPSGLKYRIVSQGDEGRPVAANQIIKYEQNCEQLDNGNYGKSQKTIAAPRWFVEGSIEAEAYALMPKNVGATYEFFLPNSNYQQLDFRIEITADEF